jgi:hypothetical protein
LSFTRKSKINIRFKIGWKYEKRKQ